MKESPSSYVIGMLTVPANRLGGTVDVRDFSIFFVEQFVHTMVRRDSQICHVDGGQQ